MLERVIYPPQYDPRISPIYALNEVDVRAPPEQCGSCSSMPTIITPNGVGCHVLTEETQQGPWFLEMLGHKHPGGLYKYHQDWVERLALAAEAKASAKAEAPTHLK